MVPGLRDLVLPIVAARLDRIQVRSRCSTPGAARGNTWSASRPGVRAVGLELMPEAFEFLRRRGLDGVARGSVCRVPFPASAFDLVVSTDVVCCIELPGDVAATRELARVLKPGGRPC
ncbi:MAG: class I SAM-dependent methyltransferase [Isosphaeraceae bacterium]